MRSTKVFVALSTVVALAGSCGTSKSTTSSGKGANAIAAPNLITIYKSFNVSGADRRGPYTGSLVLFEENQVKKFVRSVDYADSVIVEKDRKLSWLITGSWEESGSKIQLHFTLLNADFIKSRDRLTRDGSVPFSQDYTVDFDEDEDNHYAGTVDAGGVTSNERLVLTDEINPNSILPDGKRVQEAVHAPMTATQKSIAFKLFKSFQELPWVAPYVSRPDFQSAIHKRIIDTTDKQYYRKNPSRLRIINKVIDPISQLETLSRANAYRWNFAQKIGVADKLQLNSIEPVSKVLVQATRPDGSLAPDGDGAVWLGIYAASQAYRWDVTHDPQALANLRQTVDALIKHQEITGDQKNFARTLRTHQPNVQAPWVQGTGQFSNMDWLQTGNNDMIKGIFYGYIVGWQRLCPQGVHSPDYICTRLAYNARVMADKGKIAQTGMNLLMSQWLAAIVSEGMDSWGHKLKAMAAGAVAAAPLDIGTIVAAQATADWSGLNLGFVTYDILRNLELSMSITGKQILKNGVINQVTRIDEFEMPLWNMAESVFGTPNTVRNAAALSRLSEVSVPRVPMNMDYTINPDFSVSPFPNVPWKNDWTTNKGRVQGLYIHPLFEMPLDSYTWSDNPFEFQRNIDSATPYTDFIYAYWVGRKFGVIQAND